MYPSDREDRESRRWRELTDEEAAYVRSWYASTPGCCPAALRLADQARDEDRRAARDLPIRLARLVLERRTS